MNKNRQKLSAKPSFSSSAKLNKQLSEGGFIFVLCMAMYLLLSLMTYHSSDSVFNPTSQAVLMNAGGRVGAFIADMLYEGLGYLAYVLPISMGYIGWAFLREETIFLGDKATTMVRLGGLFLLMIGGCGICSLSPHIQPLDQYHNAGGVVGGLVASWFNFALNVEGATLIFLSLCLSGVSLLTGLSWVILTEKIGRYTLLGYRFITKKVIAYYHRHLEKVDKELSTEVHDKENEIKRPVFPSLGIKIPKMSSIANDTFEKTPILPEVFFNAATPDKTHNPESLPSKPILPQKKADSAPSQQVQASPSKRMMPITPSVAFTSSEGLPPLTLLDKDELMPSTGTGGYTHEALEQMSREVEQHLLDFGIQADVVAVHPGPVITRFELQLGAGIKVSKLSTLSKDLARSLSVMSVRVVEVIPGKAVVGLELPNQTREIVRLSSVLSADVYQHAHSPLTLALGVDIAGHPMVVDLAKMPHLLVAGTTGSGKSVGINAMILSILFKSSPKEVRLIMIDPKMLELSVYDGIPHLLTPVVTDMKEAASALRWCVVEMERRYRLMASLGVRNIVGYNAKVEEAIADEIPIKDPTFKLLEGMDEEAPYLESLPYIVVIIDELADMMMVVGKKVEQLIARIAQKARAAGIHLILATQRPSVDVLTGLIKSNIPTRISFQVSSKIDSRTILDQQGADQLLGHGDMLYLAPGTGTPLRVHGAYVDDKEVHRIANDWRERGVPSYIDIISQGGDLSDNGGEDGEGGSIEETDKLYDESVAFVIQSKKASISAVQRRFKIGYNRAARLVEEMEKNGIVGPLEGGMRDVLVKGIEGE